MLLEEIPADDGVFIGVIVQSTHRYDLNACDASYHSVVKRRVRQYPFPLCQEHILRDYALAAAEKSARRGLFKEAFGGHIEGMGLAILTTR